MPIVRIVRFVPPEKVFLLKMRRKSARLLVKTLFVLTLNKFLLINADSVKVGSISIVLLISASLWALLLLIVICMIILILVLGVIVVLLLVLIKRSAHSSVMLRIVLI